MNSENSDTVLRKLAAVMVQTFHLTPGTRIERSTTSADVPGWDSLSHAILIMDIEDAFGLSLPFDRVYELNDVGELIDLIESEQSSNVAP